MFICTTCIENREGPAIELAKACAPMGMSYGRCELCEKGSRDCYDIPSSADWKSKPRRAAGKGRK